MSAHLVTVYDNCVAVLRLLFHVAICFDDGVRCDLVLYLCGASGLITVYGSTDMMVTVMTPFYRKHVLSVT